MATLNLLDIDSKIIDSKSLEDFLLMCQAPVGGLMKTPYASEPDPIHTCHGLLGGALAGVFGLQVPATYDLLTGFAKLKG